MLALAAALAALTAAPARAATDVYIGVSGSRSEPARAIGLPPFAPEGAGRAEAEDLGRRLREAVRNDLAFSRYFQPVDPPSGAAAADPKTQAGEWRKAGADFVLAGKVSVLSGKGTGPEAGWAAVTAVLLDLSSGEALLQRYYRQELRHWRSLAHQISDDVTRQLTGRPGIARTQIAFVNDRTGHKEVYLADYDGEGLRQVTREGSIALIPRWRPDRKALVYTSYARGNPDLMELDLERGTTRVLLDTQGLNLAGGFSPDGRQLVLTQSRQKNPNVHLLDLERGTTRALTSHFGVDSSPTFSPDGGQVAFVSDRAGNPEVHVLELATGRIQRLTHLNWCDSPAWSPTGEWIAFAGRANVKDRMDVFLVDVTGSHLRQLTHSEGSNEDPAWSPDGRFIAFTTNRRGRRELFVMDADGSAPRAAGDIPGNSFTPSWSP